MTIIRVDNFQGIAPRYAPRKMGTYQAQEALNVDLFSRELRPIQSSMIIENPSKSGDIQSIYPLGGEWLHWTTDVDVARAPLSLGDNEERIYYTGDLQPKATDVSLATVGAGTDYPLDFYRLGLPMPETAPTVGITGGSSGTPETRTYVYTFVTEWGEESPPSDPTEYTAANDDATQWDISGMDTAPANSGNIVGAVHSGGVVTVETNAKHFLETGDWLDLASVGGMTDLIGRHQATRVDATHFSVALGTSQTYTSGGTWAREAEINTTNLRQRIYRSTSGTFRLVAEQTAGATYTDTKADTALGEELPSATWISPPAGLKGLIALPNGVLAGFFDNILCLTPPYVPHAWPEGYRLTFPFNIVAIGSFGTTVVVATTGRPFIVTGSDPSAMTDAALDINQSCVSKRSMVSVLNGVIYASPDGLVYVPGAGTPMLLTKNWMKKDDWDLFNPPSLRSFVFDDRYYGFYDSAGPNRDESGAIVFDPSESESTFTTLGNQAAGGYSDLETDMLYLVEGGAITTFGGGGSFQTFQWRSKIFTPGRPIAIKAAKVRLTLGVGVTEAELQESIDSSVATVDAAKAAGTEVHDGSFNGMMLNQYTVNGGPYAAAVRGLGNVISAVFKLYADGELVYTKNLTDSRPFRIPGGYLSDTLEFEVSGTDVTIHEVMLAETMSELAAA